MGDIPPPDTGTALLIGARRDQPAKPARTIVRDPGRAVKKEAGQAGRPPGDAGGLRLLAAEQFICLLPF
jgi:hypothetical protein